MERKKIGIITFHASYNCGSILQARALQEILSRKYNQMIEIIDFSNIGQRKIYSIFYKKTDLKSIVKNFLCIPGYKNIKQHYEEYSNYIKNHFFLSEKFYKTEKELHGIEDNYDILMCGSDQIWNIACDDFDKAYFLSFAKGVKKVAYAPSLGATNILKSPKKNEYKKLIEEFSYLSIREVNGKKWIEELTGRDDVDLIIDPTCLLSSIEWGKYIEFIPDKPNEEYLFYYAFSYNRENNRKINEISKILNLKVIIIDSKQWYIKSLYKYENFYLSKNTGPNAFLYFMKNAKYIITTSFHGSIFSIIFHKQFLYINNANHNIDDDRTSSTLSLLKLMERYILINKLSVDTLMNPIDYEKADSCMEKLTQKAFSYIEKALK